MARDDLAMRVQAWAAQAAAEGWLTADDVARIAAVEQRRPEDLFSEPQERPLVVALFGGTGVGKSSLLNKLTGRPLARTGIERPTSREATLYVHEAVALAALPPELPLADVAVHRHTVAAQRDVLWLDAPDIDSVEAANREKTLAWLPHVDVVCYVVSPERYRDDAGWRVLQQRGGRHAWLFVINRWDEGDPRQKADFERLLRSAGFEAPLVLTTCCVSTPHLPSPDETEALHAHLHALLEQHGVATVARIGASARQAELRAALAAAAQRLGSDATWSAVRQHWDSTWTQTCGVIERGLAWPLGTLAEQFAQRPETSLLVFGAQMARLARGQADAAPSAAGADAVARLEAALAALWDDWAAAKLQVALDACEVDAQRRGLAPAALATTLQPPAAAAAPLVVEHLRDAVRASLARPGAAWQRALRRVTGFFVGALPPLALVYVAFALVTTYHRAVQGQTEYPGTAFAVSSGLLVLLAWAVPYTLDRLLRPSIQRAALSGMHTGLARGLADIHAQVASSLATRATRAATQRAAATTLDEQLAPAAPAPARPDGLLARMVATRVG